MLNKTSILAIRALLHIAQNGNGQSLSPRRIAEVLDESPTYLSKVARLLVRDGMLRADRGVKGGVRLSKHPAEITLLAIVEACQGAILGAYCEQGREATATCAFHQAAVELHDAIVGVLARWTLAQLLERPVPMGLPVNGHTCVLK